MLSEADSKDLDSVEVVVPAGAYVPDSISKRYRDKLPNVKVKVDNEGRTSLSNIF